MFALEWQAGGSERNVQTIRRLEKTVHSARKKLAETETRLRELRELESYRHSISGGTYTGTAAHIAERLVGERSRRDWLPDNIKENQPLPLPASSFLTVLHLLRRLRPERCAELERPSVATNEVPQVDVFVRRTTEERAAREVWQYDGLAQLHARARVVCR